MFGFDPGFGRPVPPGIPLTVSSGWIRPRAGGTRTHGALDFPMREGTPIVSIGFGKITRLQATPSGDAGIWVAVEHPSGITSRYMHLSKVSDKLRLGGYVTKGQLLGLSGDTGSSDTPHLHLDLKATAPALLRIKDAVGEPVEGFLPEQKPYGYGFPAEPWVPIQLDEFNERTIREAAANGIPLWALRPRFTNVHLMIGIGVGIGAMLFRERKRSAG